MKKFDVIIATDLRLPGGNTSSTVEEIKANFRAGLKTGLYYSPLAARYSMKPYHDKLIECVRKGMAEFVFTGDKVMADILFIRHPRSAGNFVPPTPDSKFGKCVVIVNHPAADKNEKYYDAPTIDTHLKQHFKSILWAPIGPLARKSILEYADQIKISAEDWVNIIDTDEWLTGNRKVLGKVPVIGRVSRDHFAKWPNDKDSILAAYPDSPRYKVRVLGGAKSATEILGYIPGNWEVVAYDGGGAKKFMQTLDYFVYFHHPGWIEAFGRVMLESLAAGIVTIVPKHFKELFGEACVYAEPHEVQGIVDTYHSDKVMYSRRSRAGIAYVSKHFSYSAHVKRLGEMLNRTLELNKVHSKSGAIPPSSKPLTTLIVGDETMSEVNIDRLSKKISSRSVNRKYIYLSVTDFIPKTNFNNLLVEYLTPLSSIKLDLPQYWQKYFYNRIQDFRLHYQYDRIIFIGNRPFDGLIQFVDENSDLHTSWVQKGVSQTTDPKETARLESHFDLVARKYSSNELIDITEASK